jgi:hypothetical protein
MGPEAAADGAVRQNGATVMGELNAPGYYQSEYSGAQLTAGQEQAAALFETDCV